MKRKEISATAPLMCPTCLREFRATHDAIREAIDTERPVSCPLCEAQRKAEQPRPLTAADAILLAAADLHVVRVARGESTEFTEWELTVAAWQREPQRFGLRGYAEHHPDHKRVTMEIMGQKPSSPVVQKYIERLRPNTYRLTPTGAVRAKALAAMLSGRR